MNDEMEDLIYRDLDRTAEHMYVAAKRYVLAFEANLRPEANDGEEYANLAIPANRLSDAVHSYDEAYARMRSMTDEPEEEK